MPKQILDTDTKEFGSLMPNGTTMEVPRYQRDYSWGEVEWQDLWQDLQDLRDGAESAHYMGTMVLRRLGPRSFVVIDGQQRIATLTILALAVIDFIDGLARSGVDTPDNERRSQLLRERYVGITDPARLVHANRIRLNAADNDFYAGHIVNLRAPSNLRRLPKSNRLLWSCLEYYRKCVQELFGAQQDGASAAAFLDDFVALKLIFLVISVDDELSAYRVFETLNARGLRLTSTDFIKNLFFSLAKGQDYLMEIQRTWTEVVQKVTPERFPEFLRYRFLLDAPKVRRESLLRLVKEEVKSDTAAVQYLRNLEPHAELFRALGDTTSATWEDHQTRYWVRVLNLFRVTQPYPVLFAAASAWPSSEFASILRLICLLTFRFTVIGSKNTNELEPAYHGAARAILDGRAKGVRDVFDHLRLVYVTDQAFERDFELAEISKTAIGRYVLACLEANDPGDLTEWEGARVSIEHILPEEPVADWDASFPLDRQAEYTNRIGNLTLLEQSLNRDAGDRIFGEKRLIFEKSQFAMSREVAESFEVWNPEAVEERQRILAKRAVNIWRLDY